ncbi:RDD family protein [Methylibium sp.]|uniref:RDD family protein n=1 Tax=Methylibium sp. TaxID=2067992 RepID=UPI003D0D6183
MPALSAQPGIEAPGTNTPGLRRRLACFLYEGVLLFGVVFFCALVYSVLTDQRNAMVGRHGMLLTAFVLAPGIYFVWYWSQTGQTLPMQTWQIQLQTTDGQRLTRGRALLRYVAAWVWFLPALAFAWLAGWHDSGTRLAAALCTGIVLYALSSRLHPRRQFWHDALCGTRLVDTRAIPKRRA